MKTPENCSVLVVDDEADLREIIAFDFEAAGYNVREAHNGSEALEIVKKESIDAVVSDIRMPVMGGLELLKNLRKLNSNPSPVVVFVSGYSDVTPEEAYHFGSEGIFAKPF